MQRRCGKCSVELCEGVDSSSSTVDEPPSNQPPGRIGYVRKTKTYLIIILILKRCLYLRTKGYVPKTSYYPYYNAVLLCSLELAMVKFIPNSRGGRGGSWHGPCSLASTGVTAPPLAISGSLVTSLVVSSSFLGRWFVETGTFISPHMFNLAAIFCLKFGCGLLQWRGNTTRQQCGLGCAQRTSIAAPFSDKG